ncbi:DUF1294 domain-containing protein [Alishewanella sp. BS5-314]|uniref:DUF1294 domain-containing protein n=1 Tax=Alishewanella sp. BS5-314 TaxID=2755587 RepID=UPI0021BB95E7|nr:cold shock and DUF1294 domain-containing protein [Alishewanella sp. BS5-314]MCT8124927.1 DUF1294 domain-containing protein [Alishewanella sp. BS5-314]
MQLTGKVVFWQDKKGFGFLLCQQTEQKLFFHIRDFTDSKSRPAEGDELQFSIGTDKQGRPIATQLSILSANPATRQHPLPRLSSVDLDYTQDVALYFRAAFLMLVIIALLFGTLPYLLPILYLEASLFTYWLYQADKNAAVARQTQRLPEESLQMFSLIGGWPGALVAQKKLAHKRSKALFQREFWLVVLGNCLLLLWLMSQHGQQFLSRLALFS